MTFDLPERKTGLSFVWVKGLATHSILLHGCKVIEGLLCCFHCHMYMLGVLCFFVCLFDLACFFLSSFSSLIKTCMYSPDKHNDTALHNYDCIYNVMIVYMIVQQLTAWFHAFSLWCSIAGFLGVLKSASVKY